MYSDVKVGPSCRNGRKDDFMYFNNAASVICQELLVTDEGGALRQAQDKAGSEPFEKLSRRRCVNDAPYMLHAEQV